MSKRARDGFEKGDRTFHCMTCGKLTRPTSAGNSTVCVPCYDEAGLVNEASDAGFATVAEYLASKAVAS